MSTIEEAREQARKALRDHGVHSFDRASWAAQKYLADALRALLDATEPPKRSETSDAQREAAWAEWAPRLTDLTKSAPLYVEAFDAGWLASQRASVQADKPTEDEREALKYQCKRHPACRSTGWPPYFEHSAGCAEWNRRAAEEARR